GKIHWLRNCRAIPAESKALAEAPVSLRDQRASTSSPVSRPPGWNPSGGSERRGALTLDDGIDGGQHRHLDLEATCGRNGRAVELDGVEADEHAVAAGLHLRADDLDALIVERSREGEQEARAIPGFDLERVERAIRVFDETDDRLGRGGSLRGARILAEPASIELALEQADQGVLERLDLFTGDAQAAPVARLVADPEHIHRLVRLARQLPRVGLGLDHVEAAQDERRADRREQARPIFRDDADRRPGHTIREERADPRRAVAACSRQTRVLCNRAEVEIPSVALGQRSRKSAHEVLGRHVYGHANLRPW